MRQASSPPDREHFFRALYDAVYPGLLKFVQRRSHADHAEDVVADTFLVVWRRLKEVPATDDDARAWIYGIARNILLNTRRGEQRRHALEVRLADPAVQPRDGSIADLAVSRADLSRAWNLLSETHQEALGLAVFEELKATQAAAVLGISPVAFRLRLSRARRTLRVYLDLLPQPEAMSASLSERTTS
ncbi:RNA polymerase sigma-70 factor (ECF subfamily) [Arthrobacter pigmenti]|uniref:RNA polymerase sigma-70 factor (ECF subfamily) n=1 Tax=Arthrobacter pigmenti TaxID=271432 RepID=A0A846RUE5_9MICC|nr:sigma-70 family RNA polymerase sigma factor [Arthrobacter pigmenti]NJC23265.1 RNA polymerase sigma-70 factor (ECF subfamily) [Arthrobacter pigmenti]